MSYGSILYENELARNDNRKSADQGNDANIHGRITLSERYPEIVSVMLKNGGSRFQFSFSDMTESPREVFESSKNWVKGKNDGKCAFYSQTVDLGT